MIQEEINKKSQDKLYARQTVQGQGGGQQYCGVCGSNNGNSSRDAGQHNTSVSCRSRWLHEVSSVALDHLRAVASFVLDHVRAALLSCCLCLPCYVW